MAGAERFQSVVLDGHKGLAFEIPFDPGTAWGIADVRLRPGRRGYRVRGTLNNVRFESVVVGRARRFFVLINAQMQAECHLQAGAAVRVSLSPASAPEAP